MSRRWWVDRCPAAATCCNPPAPSTGARERQLPVPNSAQRPAGLPWRKWWHIPHAADHERIIIWRQVLDLTPTVPSRSTGLNLCEGWPVFGLEP